MDVAVFGYLLTEDGRRLCRLAQRAYDEGNELTAGARLRGDHDPAQVAAAMRLAAVRRRARPAYGEDAEVMYFTSEGLEVATHPRVADHRAEQVLRRLGRAGHVRLLDLGCGIGSDLLAAARRGIAVTGVDRDPLLVAMAEANLAALGLPGTVRVGQAETTPRDGYDVVFADPARRTGSGRVFDPRGFSPDWSFVIGLLARPAVVKLGPGLHHSWLPPGAEAEWVSLDGRLKELTLWTLGCDSGPQVRRATVLRAGRGPQSLQAHLPDGAQVPVGPVGRFVHDPDDAVTGAHLVGDLADRLGGWLLDPHLAYVSTDDLQPTPLARSYEVKEVLPFREKLLRAALRERGIGTLTIKKRGVGVTPEQLRPRLALRGSASATLIVSRTPSTAVAILATPVEPSTEDGGDGEAGVGREGQ